ncbi:hypothetical protein F4779DRAFT_247296 [Xylariaceae sp. FL0662B]|nr:hypothetical protein F4779DRAFT_247296 [Xylariaceae sp. FL0662B]
MSNPPPELASTDADSFEPWTITRETVAQRLKGYRDIQSKYKSMGMPGISMSKRKFVRHCPTEPPGWEKFEKFHTKLMKKLHKVVKKYEEFSDSDDSDSDDPDLDDSDSDDPDLDDPDLYDPNLDNSSSDNSGSDGSKNSYQPKTTDIIKPGADYPNAMEIRLIVDPMVPDLPPPREACDEFDKVMETELNGWKESREWMLGVFIRVEWYTGTYVSPLWVRKDERWQKESVWCEICA